MTSFDSCEVYYQLHRAYDLASSGDEFLHFGSPYEVLIATILSAQTTDRCVNAVTKVLFARYPDSSALAQAESSDVEGIIHSTGFYRAKARNIIAAAQVLVNSHGGAVPDDMDLLMALPGVGRKTANIVIHHAFGRAEGIAVDTHVKRVSTRLGLSDQTNPNRIEQDLLDLFPRNIWGEINGLFILHGRRICQARSPACDRCVLSGICRYALARSDPISHI
ncbi:MAG: endonuclease III [Methanobacteriota archaeon]